MRQQEILQVKRKSALWILALVLLLFSAPVTEAEEIAVVACPEGGVVQLVDLETNTVIDEIKVGLFPGNLVVDKNGDYAYIAGALSFDITILNVRTRQIEGKIAVGFVPTGLALTPDGKYLLVANSIKGRPHEGETEESPVKDILIINILSKKIIGEIETTGTPMDIAVTPDGQKAIVTEPMGGTPFFGTGRIALALGSAALVDLVAGAELSRLDLGILPIAVVVHPLGQYAYITNTIGLFDLNNLSAEGSVSVLDLTTDPISLAASVNLGILACPTDIAISPDGKKLLVSIGTLNVVVELNILNPANPVPVGFVGVGLVPMGIAFNGDGTKAIVANAIEDSYTILDTENSPPAVAATLADIGDVGPMIPTVVPKINTQVFEYDAVTELPIDFNDFATPFPQVDITFENVDVDLAYLTDAYLEISFYDLDWTTEATVKLNGNDIWLAKDLIANEGWRKARMRINKNLVVSGANVLTVKDAKNWPSRFILGSAKLILGVTMGNGNGAQLANEGSLDKIVLKSSFKLYENFPNPFNPSTEIQFDLPDQSHTVLKIVNMNGQTVRTLVDAEIGAGQHAVVWYGENDQGQKVASGSYIYYLEAEGQVVSKQMILMK
ncbi:hypothetical protein A2V82_10495 [candidate division KSB1 bacterium RBG_16_48_16]|nr:MAG: hypothetical protein A2V82_10495 [candidate division KSB1 bacterium RBG_16_48_16]